MKKFIATFIQVLLLAGLVVLVNSYTYASTNSISESKEFNTKGIQEPNFPAPLYFEQGVTKAVNGISKNKLLVLNSGNPFFSLNPPIYKNKDFNCNSIAYPDLQYELNIYIFPSHYFW